MGIGPNPQSPYTPFIITIYINLHLSIYIIINKYKPRNLYFNKYYGK